MSSSLFAGFAREDITPKIGTALYGYEPGNFSTILHDPLHVNAICFMQNNLKLLFLNFDICQIENALTEQIKEKVSGITGIDTKYILVCATHTHSAPNVAGEEGWGEIDYDYAYSIMLPKALAAAEKACAALYPVKLGIAAKESKVGMNRRMLLENGEVVLGQNPWGPYDPTMTVISFVKADDSSPFFNIVHYGCHGTACGCTTEITRDWYGVMVDRMEEITGAQTVFFNGAIGDVGPRITNGWTGGGMDYVNELGGIATRDAIDAWRTIKEWRSDPKMSFLEDVVSLPYRKLPSLDEANEAISKVKNPEELINIFYLEYKHMVDVKEVYEKNIPIPDFHTFRQQVIAIGPILFLPLPYEFFSEISLRIRQYSPYAYTLLMSNSNGYDGYFPTQDAICRGGYEVKSFISGHAFTLTDDADQRLIDAEMEIIKKI